MNILIVDPVCPKPYDAATLLTDPMGGTEATVVRIAEGLAARGHSVRVTQHNREAASKQGASYTPFKANDDFKPSHVIVLRAPLVLRTARKQYPSAKLFLWCHDIFQGDAWIAGFQALVDTQAVPVVVSDWHRTNMYETMKQYQVNAAIPCRRIYNPIAEDLIPDATPVDQNKLVFFASPHKGLERTLEVFKQFPNFPELKETKLYVANPGYFPNADLGAAPNVVLLGALPHGDVLQHVRSAFCVFHLNGVFPETFGLVHAEGNAVGTPFLNARLGAVPETCDHPGELIDVADAKAVINRILLWRNKSRPKVRGNPNFRLNKVLREWQELLAL